jgi:hypothetical protein
VQAAFQAVPAARRDSWRVHRLESGETVADLAKRYNTTSASIASANRGMDNDKDAAPEAGAWVAIPVSYPGDRVPKVIARATRKPVTAKPGSSRVETKVAAKVSPTHAAPHATATAPAPTGHAVASRPVINHPIANHSAGHASAIHPAIAQHKPGVKPPTKSISKSINKVPQSHPATRS